MSRGTHSPENYNVRDKNGETVYARARTRPRCLEVLALVKISVGRNKFVNKVFPVMSALRLGSFTYTVIQDSLLPT